MAQVVAFRYHCFPSVIMEKFRCFSKALSSLNEKQLYKCFDWFCTRSSSFTDNQRLDRKLADVSLYRFSQLESIQNYVTSNNTHFAGLYDVKMPLEMLKVLSKSLYFTCITKKNKCFKSFSPNFQEYPHTVQT